MILLSCLIIQLFWAFCVKGQGKRHHNWLWILFLSSLEVICQPPTINNGTLITLKRVFKEHDQLQFTCNKGYKFGERSDAECTENGWHPNPSCKEITCDPPSVANGTYHPPRKVFKEEDIIRVSCKAGFHFDTNNRNNIAECTKTGWMPFPRCTLRPCEYPHIENGALTRTYEYYREQMFPATLGRTIHYQCDQGYTPKTNERYSICTKEGWNPKPQCLKICSLDSFEHGYFLKSYWTTYTEGVEISYACLYDYVPENPEAKAVCTKNNWMPPPRCIYKKSCEKAQMSNGYYTQNKDKFELNEEATYRCLAGYTTPEGNEEGTVQCLKEGWTSLPKCIKAPPCEEEPPVIDFGGIVSSDKWEYRQDGKVQYKCNPGYTLTGPEWITCNGKAWTPAPQCLAPCIITKQQLDAKNLLLSNGQRYAQLIQSEHTVEFMCSKGYTLITPSVRVCVNGHLDLPSCISETGKNCSRPPTLENGDITTFLEKEYTSGSFVEFKCQKFYAMEGQNRSFCDNGNWTKTPVCLEPCAISMEEMGNHMVEVNESTNENILQWVYLNRGDFLELRCQSGYSLATNSSESTFMVQCNENPIVYPECREIVCNLPGVVNGRFRPERNIYKDGDVIIIICNRGFHNHNGQNTAECTENGWFPPPRCTQDK
ncbi:complement factor H-like isoform X3 [Pelodiscus sinensis]|uniref:complement factor H-like isoform X3 n=1 Tax=Pelodiscus sinensis TaxID=13735 RepID=UPI003F6D938C